jgi:hypothetical protein
MQTAGARRPLKGRGARPERSRSDFGVFVCQSGRCLPAFFLFADTVQIGGGILFKRTVRLCHSMAEAGIPGFKKITNRQDMYYDNNQDKPVK